MLSLSKHIFWDIDKSTLDFNKHSRFIIERVLTHGNLSDWKSIKLYYGLDKIKEESLQIRSLDKKTLNLLSLILKTPIENFRCYTQTQSTNTHWNY